jgi:hypothetical protein
MPEHTTDNPMPWHPPAPSTNPHDVHRALTTTLAASTALTAAWSLISGLTGYHYTMALPVIGAVLALALISTPARRRWFPALAAVLGFAVGYLGDIAAVALLLWRHGYGAGLIADHFTDLARAVNDGHSTADWAYFLGSALTAAVCTAALQYARPAATGTPARS